MENEFEYYISQGRWSSAKGISSRKVRVDGQNEIDDELKTGFLTSSTIRPFSLLYHL